MGKANLAAYRNKRDVRARMPYHSHVGIASSLRLGGFGGIKSSQPFGHKRKGGQTINWGVMGKGQTHSYDGPKRFVPKPELAEAQAKAKAKWLKAQPSILVDWKPMQVQIPAVTDHLGLPIFDGPVIYDVAMGRRLYSPEPPVAFERKHKPIGTWPTITQVSERQAEHDTLAAMVAAWVNSGNAITQCRTGKRFKG